MTCRSIVDVRTSNYDAGVIVSQLPERIPIYANEDERCDIHISIPTGHEMMFYFDWLDLYSGDLIQCDTASIELFDGSSNLPVKGRCQSVYVGGGYDLFMPMSVISYLTKIFLTLLFPAIWCFNTVFFAECCIKKWLRLTLDLLLP